MTAQSSPEPNARSDAQSAAEIASPDFTAAPRSPASNFDTHNPPEPELIDDCVHCGFCLATCPSYRVIGKEMDSPRGRIDLMDAVNDGRAPLSSATIQHFDTCLGCLACVSACPSDVQYDKLIAATRPQVERNYDRSWRDWLVRQLIFQLFPYPNRLRPLLAPLWFYQRSGLQGLVRRSGLLERLFPRLGAMESILPRITADAFRDSYPEVIPAQETKRYRVGLILGCVQRLFFSPVNAATARVLSANGCEVVVPRSQGCCAALPEHQGQEEQGKALARQMVDAFEGTGVDAVIINAAGCGHTLKEYGNILADDPQYCEKAADFADSVKDVQQFLAEVGMTAELSPLTQGEFNVVYQDACHLRHGQQISLQPRQLLQQIPGLKLREPADAALCCGSSGVYNMLQPGVADELGDRKVDNLLATGADAIASPNPGCSLQIQKHLRRKGRTMPLLHPMELFDRAIRGTGIEL
ncbi:MAG: glycolate oxidase [Cyanobacteria bacterium QS_8_64_29]|nr:MAG: glycolate oxidase [Cyanobacteria bacterium QS_8_64_29]